MLDDQGSRTPPPGIASRLIDFAGGHILHDALLLPQPDMAFFEPQNWRDRDAVIGAPQGRSAVCVFRHQGQTFVLRHYHRGGWIAKLSRDRYWWSGLERTRAWREWRLLAALHGLGLPVPRPVAARVQRHGLFYSADLVTVHLADTRTLADILSHDAVPEPVWRRIGCVIRRFHEHGIFHADLNARNILIDKDGAVFLIDFDKGYRGAVRSGVRHDNLERLQRSLRKFRRSRQSFHFDSQAWQCLLNGYREAA